MSFRNIPVNSFGHLADNLAFQQQNTVFPAHHRGQYQLHQPVNTAVGYDDYTYVADNGKSMLPQQTFPAHNLGGQYLSQQPAHMVLGHGDYFQHAGNGDHMLPQKSLPVNVQPTPGVRFMTTPDNQYQDLTRPAEYGSPVADGALTSHQLVNPALEKVPSSVHNTSWEYFSVNGGYVPQQPVPIQAHQGFTSQSPAPVLVEHGFTQQAPVPVAGNIVPAQAPVPSRALQTMMWVGDKRYPIIWVNKEPYVNINGQKLQICQKAHCRRPRRRRGRPTTAKDAPKAPYNRREPGAPKVKKPRNPLDEHYCHCGPDESERQANQAKSGPPSSSQKAKRSKKKAVRAASASPPPSSDTSATDPPASAATLYPSPPFSSPPASAHPAVSGAPAAAPPPASVPQAAPPAPVSPSTVAVSVACAASPAVSAPVQTSVGPRRLRSGLIVPSGKVPVAGTGASSVPVPPASGDLAPSVTVAGPGLNTPPNSRPNSSGMENTRSSVFPAPAVKASAGFPVVVDLTGEDSQSSGVSPQCVGQQGFVQSYPAQHTAMDLSSAGVSAVNSSFGDVDMAIDPLFGDRVDVSTEFPVEQSFPAQQQGFEIFRGETSVDVGLHSSEASAPSGFRPSGEFADLDFRVATELSAELASENTAVTGLFLQPVVEKTPAVPVAEETFFDTDPIWNGFVDFEQGVEDVHMADDEAEL